MQGLEQAVNYLELGSDDETMVGGAVTIDSLTLPQGLVMQVDQLEGTKKFDSSGERVEFIVDDADGKVYAQLQINGIGTQKVESESGRGIGKTIGPFSADKVINLKARNGNPATGKVGAFCRLRRRHAKPSSEHAYRD